MNLLDKLEAPNSMNLLDKLEAPNSRAEDLDKFTRVLKCVFVQNDVDFLIQRVKALPILLAVIRNQKKALEFYKSKQVDYDLKTGKSIMQWAYDKDTMARKVLAECDKLLETKE